MLMLCTATNNYMKDLSQVFAQDGPLSNSVADFKPRQAQTDLALAIQDTIENNKTLVAEAGTGTGKTWAYLVPAFLNGSKALVSTGTRTLQDQLFHRDIPRLREALQMPITVSLLKGRANYVCHYHLQRLLDGESLLDSKYEINDLRHVEVFTKNSNSGDKSDLDRVPEHASIWSKVTSTRENCLGQECPFVSDCFLLKARRKAQDADLVVVNHALYMADLALRDQGLSDLLPKVDVVIFDEAHQLPDVATRFLGYSVSIAQLLDVAKQVEVTGLAHALESNKWADICKKLEATIRDLRLQSAPMIASNRVLFKDIPNADDFDAALQAVIEEMDVVIKALTVVQDSHLELQAILNTVLEIRHRLILWSQPDRQGKFMAGIEDSPENLQAVRWVELSQNFMRLHRAPLSVAQLFSKHRSDEQAWVFTSATLSVNKNFNHFLHQLGLHGADTLYLESPYDYENQAMLYVPQDLPLPSDFNFYTHFTNCLHPLIQATNGGVLILCTTLRAIDIIGEKLQDLLQKSNDDKQIFMQGHGSRMALLDKFRDQGNAILIGSASFWEGVDIPGSALSLLAIDKLPFAPPDDPVLQARLNACKTDGGNPFMEYQIPQAAITLKQGAGRLIRSENDKGVLMVGDTRLVDKSYGRLLWRGLPPFVRTRLEQTAVDFIKASS